MPRPCARQLMARNLVTVPDDLSVTELARVLAENHVLGVPVLDARGGLVGVVSASDIAASEVGAAREIVSERDYYCRPDLNLRGEYNRPGMHLEMDPGTRVRDIMTPVVISAPPEATPGELAELMGMNRIHRVLVVENGQLLGVVSALDVLGYVPRGTGLPGRQAQILWATDLGPTSDRVGARALELANRLGGQLVILHVTPDLTALWAAYGARPETVDLQQRLEQRSLERLHDLAAALEREQQSFELIARTGAPDEVILAVIAERHPELVVIGAQRSEKERLQGLGSVAEKVLAASPVPILTVPSR